MSEAFIFDLDGVIVDTAKYHYMAWKKLCEELGLQFSIQDNELLKGVSRRRSFEIILQLNNRQMDEEAIDACCQKKNKYYKAYIDQLQKEEILPGAKEFLCSARQKGLKVALGSASKNSKKILERLEIEGLFDAVVDGHKVKNAKPDPEVFTEGAKELGVKAENCIVFEDSAAGISAAHSGGMKAVGVGNRSIADYCDYYIDDFVNADAGVIAKKVSGE